MKKYIISLVSFALAVASLAMTLNSPNFAITAGAGNEIDSEVENLNDVYSVLNFIISRNSGEKSAATQEKNAAEPTAAIKYFNESTPETNIHIESHSSVTATEDTEMSASMIIKDSTTNTQLSKTDISFRRSLTAFMTLDKTYYISKGCISSSSVNYKDSEKNSSAFMDFDMQIYIENNIALVKINKFVMSRDEDRSSIKSDYAGKWIELSHEEAFSLLQMVDEGNKSYLEEVRTVIEADLISGNSKFDNINDIYTCTEGDVDFTVDLSDITSPFIEVCSDVEEGQNHSYISDVLSFSNIDNTVINMDLNGVTVLKNVDFEDIFSD